MNRDRRGASFAGVMGVVTAVILCGALGLLLLRMRERGPEAPPEDPTTRFQRETSEYLRFMDESRARVEASRHRRERSLRRVELAESAGKLDPAVRRVEIALQATEIDLEIQETQRQSLASEDQVRRSSEFLRLRTLPGLLPAPPDPEPVPAPAK